MEPKQPTLQELLHPEDSKHPIGIFNPTLRFAFTNITEMDFVSYWGGQPITIKAGKTVELSHHLAVKLVKEIVDKIMTGEFKFEEEEYYKNNPSVIRPNFRSPRSMSLGVPQARLVYEQKVVKLLDPDEESPDIQAMRVQIRDEILAAQNGDATSVPVESVLPSSIQEFADINNRTPQQEPKPLKLKEV